MNRTEIKEELEILGLIYKNRNNINFNLVSKTKGLSEDFIRTFGNKVNWDYISQFQILSESFINEFKTNISWSSISKYQLLSWDFIKKTYE